MPVVKILHTPDIKRSLRINLKEDPACLDPRQGRNMSADSQVQAMLFEGLLRLEPDGQLSAAQASHYTLSQDQKTYTFYLRQTFWSDGSQVTASDFEKTWKTILTPSFPSWDIHALFCIKNAKAAKEGKVPISEVGISSLDEKTLVIELEHPTLHFLHVVASSLLFPVNQAQNALCPDWHKEATAHFIGNGPFVLEKWIHHEEMILRKNPYYREAHHVNLDEIQIHMINSGIARLHMHANGLFDIVGLPLSNVPQDLYRQLIHHDLMHVIQTPATMVCMFNTKQFPFHNRNMRKAFGHAIDRQELVKTITFMKEEPAEGIIPLQFHKEKEKVQFKKNLSPQEYLEKGLEELHISEKELWGKIKLSYWRNDHCCPEIPQFFYEQWKEKLGIAVELEGVDFRTLHEKGKTGDFSMGYFVPSSMYYDPLEILERFQYTDNPRNYPRWENHTYIKCLEEAKRESDPEKRFSMLSQADMILVDEMPCAPIFYWNLALLVQPHVHDFSISPLGHLHFDRINLTFQ